MSRASTETRLEEGEADVELARWLVEVGRLDALLQVSSLPSLIVFVFAGGHG